MLNPNIYLERLQPHQFNMVNSNNEKLQKLGLKPLYITMHPAYINLSGNILYEEYGKVIHENCNVLNDIERVLGIMNSNTYNRFEKTITGLENDAYSLSFSVYNHQIFFNDLRSLQVYKSNLNIRREIMKKYNLEDNFYEPTIEEIENNYGEKYFQRKKSNNKEGGSLKYFNYYLTPQEYIDLLYAQEIEELAPFIKSNELTGKDVREWLNCNANIFMDFKYPWEATGVYNQKAMEYINFVKESKLQIYNFLYQFLKVSEDWKKTLKDLLEKFEVYSEFIPQKNTNPLDSERDEQLHWNIMFAKAAPDILVQFIGFDKLETQCSKTITTSKPNIYEEFFNAMIMDYNIVQLPKLLYEEEKQQFRWIDPKEFINAGINREYEQDIKLIKKYVPYNERYKYFKR